jgi:DNA-binding XRE family transcriptional regulator
MNGAGDNHNGGHAEKPDRNRKPGTLSRLLAFHVSHGPETTGQRQAELQQQLREMGREQLPFGQRLHELRRALGWTQGMAAVELGISVRTVIRHEKGQHRTPWVRIPLLLKLRHLERVCAEEILAYLARGEREHSWLPSAQRRLDG